MPNNPYAELTPQEIKKREQEKKDIETRIKAVAEIGRRCLDNPDFKKYKNEFEILRTKALKFMTTYADPDPIKDAFLIRAWLNKLDILQLLLEMPSTDLKKGNKV